MKHLRIVLDALVYNRQSAGIGQYIRELTEAYQARYGQEDELIAYLSPGMALNGVRAISPGMDVSRSRSRLLYEQLVLPGSASRLGYDVLHFPDYQLPVFRPMPRTVITIHDLAAFRFPAVFPALAARTKQFLMRRSVRLASHIVVPSHATRQDLVEILGVPLAKISVVPHGVRQTGRILEEKPYPRPFFLAVGTLEPRKNFARLIEAYALLRERLKGDVPDLVFAGRRGWMYEDILKAPETFHIQSSVAFLEYVSDDTLKTLYHHSVALAYPSLYEGFGLPVIEAMHAGVPVVSSARGALKEVGEDVAVWVDPEDIGSIAEGLKRILDAGPEIRSRIELGKKRAQLFRWDTAAELTRSVYRTVVEGGLDGSKRA